MTGPRFAFDATEQMAALTATVLVPLPANAAGSTHLRIPDPDRSNVVYFDGPHTDETVRLLIEHGLGLGETRTATDWHAWSHDDEERVLTTTEVAWFADVEAAEQQHADPIAGHWVPCVDPSICELDQRLAVTLGAVHPLDPPVTTMACDGSWCSHMRAHAVPLVLRPDSLTDIGGEECD